MIVPQDSQCGEKGHVWHLPEARHIPPAGGETGPRPDEPCYCGEWQFKDLPAGKPYGNVYTNLEGEVLIGPKWHEK